MNATTALTSAAVSVPLTMTAQCTNTATSTAAQQSASASAAASEMISNPHSFNNAFNAAAALGHLSSRKDYYARTDLTFLVVFPLLFGAFNLCYWVSLFFWRADEEVHLQSL